MARIFALTAALVLAGAVVAQADSFGSGVNQFALSFVPIGNAGNANDSTGYGGVPYSYNMSVTDVSQAMLADAATLSGSNLGGGAWTGSQPAASVTWYEAAAFVNWLNTSQGYTAAYNLTYTGNQPTGITLQTGANVWMLGGADYFRNANAHYFLPSENEWYKAAYHNGSSYFIYATGSNTLPTAVASGTTAGTVVYNSVGSQPAAVDQSGGLSPYGTQGQTGNLYQWMETDSSDPTNSTDGWRTFRGGAWNTNFQPLLPSFRSTNLPTASGSLIGFRVASVPEPSSAVLIVSASLFLLIRRHRHAD